MARPTTKDDLILTANLSFEKLWKTSDSMKKEALEAEFDFSNDEKKKEAHWQRDRNLRDILTHLYEWHQLLLNWISFNTSGKEAPFLPAPYNWKTYGEMNIEFWKKHQETSFETSVILLKESHKEVMEAISLFSSEELFTRKYFSWTGTTTLGSYCVSATCSHYDWAIKKLKAHNRKF